MDALNTTLANMRRTLEPHQLTITTSLAILLVLGIFFLRPPGQKQPPALPETIPYISNTLQYMKDMDTFLSRARKSLRTSNILSFRLASKPFYFLTAPANIQTFFRTSPAIGFETMILLSITNMMGASPADVAKFAADKSGRAAIPNPGTEGSSKRYWFEMQNIFHKYLSTTHHTNALARTYQTFFGRELDNKFEEEEEGKWTETRVVPLMKEAMAKAAILSLQGEYIFEVVPDLLDRFWEYDKVLATVLFGPPRWLFRGMYDTAERFLGALAGFHAKAVERFDWGGEDVEKDWEPVFGSRFWREFAGWMVECGFSERTCGGFTGVTGIVAVNASTIAVCTWAVMEMVRDPGLLSRLKEEVEGVVVVEDGKRTFDVQRLVGLPLLQSVFTEVLRLRVSINITRAVVQPLELEGYTLKPGSVLQAPTELSHYNEEIWGVEGHPASEFWAERHVTYVDGVPVYEMRGRPTDFFPFGGGLSICPGRHFAKQEIMLTIAMLASKFDFEFIGWVHSDGSPSDRPPINDPKYAGASGVPPDRDMRVRVRRLW